MTRRLAVLTLLGAACIAAHGSELGDRGAAETGDRLAARFADDAVWQRVRPRLALLGAEVDEVITRTPLRLVLRIGARAPLDVAGIASVLAASPGVDYAVAERFLPMELRAAEIPDDPLFGAQWPLDNTGQGGRPSSADVGALEAWSYTLGSPEVLIAVLDDGVQLDHPDLAPNLAGPGRDFTVTPPGGDASPRTSADRHGTSVAGVAAARGGNALGVSGICPRCRILPVRVHGSSNLGTAAAFRYAVEQGADVITNSWGYTRAVPFAADDAVQDAIDSAAREGRGGRGALIVFGVTNETVDNCAAEHADISSLASVVAVGVANHNDELGGSGYGPCLDLVAPAKPKDRSTIGVPTTDRTGGDGHTADDYYLGFGGTSAAAPLVAGIAGLLLSLNPELTGADLLAILEHTADKIDRAHAAYDAAGFSERAGYGRVNAARALVPTVTIAVAPAAVAPGEPFSVTVTASAPFGLESLAWSGRGTGIPDLDAEHRRTTGGAIVRSITWKGVVVGEPGTFTLAAEARDQRYTEPRSGYPHRTGERAGAPTATLTVVERSGALPR